MGDMGALPNGRNTHCNPSSWGMKKIAGGQEHHFTHRCSWRERCLCQLNAMLSFPYSHPTETTSLVLRLFYEAFICPRVVILT